MARPTILLVNPPLWNAYAPHLAVPLLAGVLGDRGWPCAALDLSIETMDYLLSPSGLLEIEKRLEVRAGSADDLLERRRTERALLLLPGVVEEIEDAKFVLRSLSGLRDGEAFASAQRTMRCAMSCISAAFDGLDFDLTANDLYYSARSSRAVLDATADPDRNIYRWTFDRLGLDRLLANPKLGLIGISVSADTQLIAAMTFARMARESRPDVRIVMGGNFATRIAIRWREPHPFFTLVDDFVLYEGEDALPSLCERLFEGDTTVPGLVSVVGDRLVAAPSHEVDLAAIPAPDYSDMPLGKYFAPGPIVPTYASRSCAWSCTFCSIPFASNKFRRRTGEQVVDEMEVLAERHDTKFFYLVDEILTIRSLAEVSDVLLARGHDFYWYGETRFANGWTPQLAERLYASGCRRLSFGLESYNQRILDRMQKGTDVSYIDENVDALLAAQIPLHLFTILGFPGETEEESVRTLAYCRDVVRRSKESYGVDHTTWAAAPFVLDLHSPVARDPAAFGVEIVAPPPDEDLALTATFHVAEGLQQESSWRLAREASGTVVDLHPNTFWFDLPVRHEVEERLFLRAALGAGSEQEPERPLVSWMIDDSIPVPITAGVTVRWTSVLPMQARATPGLLLHRPSVGAVFSLPNLDPSHEGTLLGSTSLVEKAQSLAAALTRPLEETHEIVSALARFGFFACARALPLDPNDAVFRQEPFVSRSFDVGTRRGLLRSETTGAQLAIGAVAFGTFLLGADAGTTVDDDRARRLRCDQGEYAEHLLDLVRHGFLYALPRVDSGLARSHRATPLMELVG